MKVNSKPSKKEFLIGWYIEELSPSLVKVVDLLVERGITPIIEEADIKLWEAYEPYGDSEVFLPPKSLYMKGLTLSQHRFLSSIGKVEGGIGRMETIKLTLQDDWIVVLEKLGKNGLRLLGGSEKLKELWKWGTPKKYKGIRILGE